RAWRSAGDYSGRRHRLPGAPRRSYSAGHSPACHSYGPGACQGNGNAREGAGGTRVSLQRFFEITQKNPSRPMRILNVTETYAPFLEFGGPPIKVRARFEGLARRGHQMTVLTADWGLEKRLQTSEEKNTAERSPFGWRRRGNGVEGIYLSTWVGFRG